MSTYPRRRVTNVSPPRASSFRQMKGMEYRSRLEGSVRARTTVCGRYDGGAGAGAGAGARAEVSTGRRWVTPASSAPGPSRTGTMRVVSSCCAGEGAPSFSSTVDEEA